jgi:aromatic-L-amino-acid decarboxylase
MADMRVEDFRYYGHQLVDWMTEYLGGAQKYPVMSGCVPGDVRASLPTSAPFSGESMETILKDIESLIVPNVSHWNTPGFMGYFSVTSSAPSILAEMLDSTLNVGRFLWRTAPAATELEQVVVDWLRQALGLPAGLFGMLHHNSAIVHAISI